MKIVRILLLFLFVCVNAQIPVTLEDKIVIGDNYNSYRGYNEITLKRHKAIDLVCNDYSDKIYCIQSGVLRHSGSGMSFYVFGDDSIIYSYNHALPIFDDSSSVHAGDEIGEVMYSYGSYPHLELQCINDSILEEPLDYLEQSILDYLQKPKYFYFTSTDTGNITNKVVFQQGMIGSGVYKTADNESYVIYGGVNARFAPACYTSAKYDLNTETVQFDPDYNFNINEISPLVNELNPKPLFSQVFTYGAIVDGNIYYQTDYDKCAFDNSALDPNNLVINGLYLGGTSSNDVEAPYSMYLFTNKDTSGAWYTNNELNVKDSICWLTNVKEGTPGFYVENNKDEKYALSNKEAKFTDGLHWVKVFASNYPSTNVFDDEHFTIDSVPVILDNFSIEEVTSYGLRVMLTIQFQKDAIYILT